MRVLPALLFLLATTLAACTAAVDSSATPASPRANASVTASPSATAGPGSPTASPSPSGAPTQALSLSPEPSPGGSSDSVIVTFRTAGDEEYRILLTDAEDIAMARRLLAGQAEGYFPNGRIVLGGDGGVNTGYSWHIDPDSVGFAQFTIEQCDGRPSYVEDGTLTGDRFCPWTAVVVAVEPAG